MRSTLAIALIFGLGACTANDSKPKTAALDKSDKTDSPKAANNKQNDKQNNKPEKKDPPAAGKAKEAAPASLAQTNATANSPKIEHTVENIEGKPVQLSDYRGKALLIVNTASQCGYTPQYEGLQELHAKYAEQGLVVMGFPSNDFGGQEPGSHEDIAKFVKQDYGVEFPMFAKVKTKGEGQAPLYKTLTEETPKPIQGEVEWNFTKFLIDPSGHVVERFNSNVDPMDAKLTAAVERVLPKADQK